MEIGERSSIIAVIYDSPHADARGGQQSPSAVGVENVVHHVELPRDEKQRREKRQWVALSDAAGGVEWLAICLPEFDGAPGVLMEMEPGVSQVGGKANVA